MKKRPPGSGRLFMVVLAEAKRITRRTVANPSARPQPKTPRPPDRTRVTNDLRRKVVARYETGIASAQACADEFHIAKATVLRILREAGVTIRPQGKRLT